MERSASTVELLAHPSSLPDPMDDGGLEAGVVSSAMRPEPLGSPSAPASRHRALVAAEAVEVVPR